MEDKIFKLLENMYYEMQEMKKEIKQDITKIQSTIENNLIPDIKLSLQGFIDTNEKLASIEDKVKWVKDKQFTDSVKIDVAKGKIEMLEVSLDKTSKSIVEKIETLSSKIEKHDVEINVIKRVI